VLTDLDTCIRARTSCTLFSAELATAVQEVANVSSDVINSVHAQYYKRRRIEYILQWPEVNGVVTVQDAVAVINPTDDEDVYHGLSSRCRQ